MKVGDVYYMSDQFGVRFVKITDICKIWDSSGDIWVVVDSSPWLKSVIDDMGNKSQYKMDYFERLISEFKFNIKFRGAILIPDNIIQSVSNDEKIDINLPYITDQSPNTSSTIFHRYLCRELSKDDFRNIKLNRILD